MRISHLLDQLASAIPRPSLGFTALLVMAATSVFLLRGGQDTASSDKVLSRSERFVPSVTAPQTIHIVKEASHRWFEREFFTGFETCPHYTNCRVEEHTIGNDSKPFEVPHKGTGAVVFTVEAVNLIRNSEWWSQAASMRPDSLLWVLQSMRNPFEYPLDFLTFRNYGFNVTMTYKPESDVFTPFNIWDGDSDAAISPKMRPVMKNFAANKTRKVIWPIEGKCVSINNRLQYAKELAQFIPVDIIGHCEDADGRVKQVDYSTHGNSGRRGVIEDYKFYLAFEEISCRDYITNVYFSAAKLQSVVPVVMGAQKEAYDLVGPPDAFVHIDDFSGPEDLAAYLRRLDDDDHKFNAFFSHVGRGQFELPATSMCRLCDLVNFFASGSIRQSYDSESFRHFWTPADCNTNSLIYDNLYHGQDGLIFNDVDGEADGGQEF